MEILRFMTFLRHSRFYSGFCLSLTDELVADLAVYFKASAQPFNIFDDNLELWKNSWKCLKGFDLHSICSISHFILICL